MPTTCLLAPAHLLTQVAKLLEDQDLPIVAIHQTRDQKIAIALRANDPYQDVIRIKNHAPQLHLTAPNSTDQAHQWIKKYFDQDQIITQQPMKLDNLVKALPQNDETTTQDNNVEPKKSKGQLNKEQRKLNRAAAKAAARGENVEGITVQGSSKPAISLDPPSGTRDFFPEEMRVRSWLFRKFRETARLLGFQEYDAPVLESEDLYKRKGGEEITQQMYNFVDKDGKLVTLRPEMTPSVARMILSLGDSLLLPVKWFSIPQCWRFETVQRGRKREHFQWNMDIFGEPSVAAEAELLAGITTFFASCGITSADVGIKINSRRVLAAVLRQNSVDNDQFPVVCVIVDKLDKIGPEETIQKLVDDAQLPQSAAEQIVASLNMRSIEELEQQLGENATEAAAEIRDLFKLAEAAGFADWLYFDASVVRGLAYYTGIVFEGFDRKGELRAICGGGRYDKLLTLYGSPKVVPACGFGFGDCVLMELLKDKGLVPTLGPRIDFVVAAYCPSMKPHAFRVSAMLRSAGYAVDTLLAHKKVDRAFRYADRVNGERMLFVAPDEWARGCIMMKELRVEMTEEEMAVYRGVEVRVETLIEALAERGISPMD